MRVLVVHPEGNLLQNVNLLGLLEKLAAASHAIVYVAPRRAAIPQALRTANIEVRLVDRTHVHGRFLFRSEADAEPDPPLGGFDFVLGIDRGIIDAARFARRDRIRHALISYEIFFADETSPAFKLPEREACASVEFAVAQDRLRARLLGEENAIPGDRFLLMPVAGAGFRGAAQAGDADALRALGVPDGTHTVLYVGSVAAWTGAPFLLASTRHWPSHWTLVLHERNGISDATRAMVATHADPARVLLSSLRFERPDDMAGLMRSATLGAALYVPTGESPWVGRNIGAIGLSSSKIASYLQHGTPVATHELGEISRLIESYGAGQVFSMDAPFVPAVPPASARAACRALFEAQLDLDRHAGAVIAAIESGHGAPRAAE